MYGKQFGVFGELAEGAFLVGAATRPRRTARAVIFLGFVVIGLAGLITWGTGNLGYIVWGVLLFPFFLLAALVARIIGWISGMGMEAAQDVIHDRYQEGHDIRGHFNFDPRTGEPIAWRYDPYTGRRLED